MKEVDLVGTIELPGEITATLNAGASVPYAELETIPAMSNVSIEENTVHVMDSYNLYPCCALRGACPNVVYDPETETETVTIRMRFLLGASSRKTAKFRVWRIYAQGEATDPLLYDSEYALPPLEYEASSIGYAVSGILNVPCDYDSFVTVRIALEELDAYGDPIGCMMYSRQCVFYLSEKPVDEDMELYAELTDVLPFEEEGDKYHVSAVFLGRWQNVSSFRKFALGDSYDLLTGTVGWNSHYSVVQYVHGIPRQVIVGDFYTGEIAVKVPTYDVDDRNKVLTVVDDDERFIRRTLIETQFVTITDDDVMLSGVNMDRYTPGSRVQINVNGTEYQSEIGNDYTMSVLLASEHIVYGVELRSGNAYFSAVSFGQLPVHVIPGDYEVGVIKEAPDVKLAWTQEHFREATLVDGRTILDLTYNDILTGKYTAVSVYSPEENTHYVRLLDAYWHDEDTGFYYVSVGDTVFEAYSPNARFELQE